MPENWTHTTLTRDANYLLDSLSGVSKSLLEVSEVRVIGRWWGDHLQQAWTQLCGKPEQEEGRWWRQQGSDTSAVCFHSFTVSLSVNVLTLSLAQPPRCAHSPHRSAEIKQLNTLGLRTAFCRSGEMLWLILCMGLLTSPTYTMMTQSSFSSGDSLSISERSVSAK